MSNVVAGPPSPKVPLDLVAARATIPGVHPVIGGLPGMGPRRDPAVAARIRSWLERALDAGDDRSVMGTELECSEPGCAPVETVVAIMDPAGTIQFKMHDSAASLSQEDIVAALGRAGASGAVEPCAD